MDTLKIGNKTYDLYIGFDFIRELDKRHSEEVGGVRYGFGVGMLSIDLMQRNPTGILDFIQAATITEKQKPGVKDIEALIVDYYNKGKLEDLYVNFTKRLNESPFTEPTLTAISQLATENQPKK